MYTTHPASFRFNAKKLLLHTDRKATVMPALSKPRNMLNGRGVAINPAELRVKVVLGFLVDIAKEFDS